MRSIFLAHFRTPPALATSLFGSSGAEEFSIHSHTALPLVRLSAVGTRKRRKSSCSVLSFVRHEELELPPVCPLSCETWPEPVQTPSRRLVPACKAISAVREDWLRYDLTKNCGPYNSSCIAQNMNQLQLEAERKNFGIRQRVAAGLLQNRRIHCAGDGTVLFAEENLAP
ncbi:hypothetical protein MA16_Dca014227 [Dendrobium catenatum]|uniref:Uncharacterized protein n=1 Tax=Dendrobium catenatum TaxID=906689 RepID=A0A2I0VZB5_9ASPA|nr:hypothetical protein MA16_Dca014227 [Dendrobium catenatum]